MTFDAKPCAAIERWKCHPVPLKVANFRSVEYRYMDPADVLSGAGTRDHRERFTAVGIRTVYLSATDSGAGKEGTARKAWLGGAAQISTGVMMSLSRFGTEIEEEQKPEGHLQQTSRGADIAGICPPA